MTLDDIIPRDITSSTLEVLSAASTQKKKLSIDYKEKNYYSKVALYINRQA